MTACTSSRSRERLRRPGVIAPISTRVGAQEHQVVQHPVELGEQRPRPGRPPRHLHPQHPLDREHHAELGGERREPVVPVREHQDLPVVAHLEELLGPPVQVADHRLAADDPVAVERQPQPQRPVRGRVLRARFSTMSCSGKPRRPGADPDGDVLGHEPGSVRRPSSPSPGPSGHGDRSWLCGPIGRGGLLPREPGRETSGPRPCEPGGSLGVGARPGGAGLLAGWLTGRTPERRQAEARRLIHD